MMTKDEALKLALEALGNIYHGFETSPRAQYTAITAINEALAQPEPVMDYDKEELRGTVWDTSKHNDELVEIQREEVKSKIAQLHERNFCHRCGKRLMSALGPVSIHTCCPPQGRTFDDYGNKIL